MSGEHQESFLWFKHAFPAAYENAQNLLHTWAGWPFSPPGHGQTWIYHHEYPTAQELAAHGGHNTLEGHGPLALMHVSLVFVIIVLVAWLAYGRIRDKQTALVPDEKFTVRTFVEVLVGAAYGMMKDIMGAKAARFFLPLIGTCAFFILFSNALGLVPGFAPPTSSLAVTLAMALVIFFTTHIFGVKEHGLAYFKHFLGPIIKWYAFPLMILFLVIETISHVVRPISLSIRLMANMSADHAVIAAFLGLVPWIVPVPFVLLGSLVVVVQTVVFCLLSTVYIAMAIEHAEEH